MLDAATAGSAIPPASTLGPRTEAEPSLVAVERFVRDVFTGRPLSAARFFSTARSWVCLSCKGWHSIHVDHCENDIPQADGTDVRCGGDMLPAETSARFCGVCQSWTPGNDDVCADCEADARMERTQPIPHETLAEVAAIWRAKQEAV